MITEDDRKFLIKNIPFRFTKIVQEILLKDNEKVYSDRHIAKVYNGKHTNIAIESAIWKLNKNIIQKKNKINKQKEEAKKNSKAVTLESK